MSDADKPEVKDGFLITTGSPQADRFALGIVAGTTDRRGQPTVDVAAAIASTNPGINAETGKLAGTRLGEAVDALSTPQTREALNALFAGNAEKITAFQGHAKDGTPGVLLHVDNDGDPRNNLRGIYNVAKKTGFKLDAKLPIPTPLPTE